MTVETATEFDQLDPALPSINDLKREAPQHFWLLKNLLKNYFSSLGPDYLTVTSDEINELAGITGNVQVLLDAIDAAKADLAGATYTGTHDFTGATLTAATQPLSDSSTKVATMAALAAAALAAALPGQAGAERKWIKSNGTTASWEYLALDAETITTNTTAVPGKFYIIATQDITLTMPTTPNVGDPIGFGMARGLTRAYVDWGSHKLKGRTPGVMTLQTQNDAAIVQYTGATDGFMGNQ